MLRTVLLTALVAPGAALIAAKAPMLAKPVVAGRAGRAVLTVANPEETGGFEETVANLGITALRVGTCALMVHHGIDKLQHVEGFSTNVIAAYFPFLPGPPEFWTYLSASFELGGSFCLVVGVVVRPAAALLTGTMLNAIAFQLMKNGLQGWPFGVPPHAAYTFEPSLAFFGVTVYIALAGPGGYSCRPAPPKPMTSIGLI